MAWPVCLFLSFILFTSSLSAQNFQTLYSNLDNATSLYLTQNEIYVVEQGKNRLLKLDHNGKLLESIGGKGSGDYQFSKPVDVDATNGLKIYVSDYNNQRVQVFDRRGQYLSSIKAPSEFNSSREFSPTQLVVNGLGEVFFVDEITKTIQWYDLDGNRIDAFPIPGEVKQVSDLVFAGQRMYILDKKAGVIHELRDNGMYRSFYPAEGTQAFYTDGSVFWKLNKDNLVIEGKSAKNQRIAFEKEIKPAGIQVVEDQVYILAKDRLYKLKR